MSNERADRRTSILRNPAEWAEMNRTTGGGVNRRVSFHNLRTVQQFDVEHGHFHNEPKSEYFSLSSISSADEATRHSSKHEQQLLVNSNNADQENQLPHGYKKRQSVGADDTRLLFTKNDQSNLTLQFGARPSINDTLSDDNTQALFVKTQQTCTEAFFEQIHNNDGEHMLVESVQTNLIQNITMNNDATEDFLENIASQARHPEPSNNSMYDDSLAGEISPKAPTNAPQQYSHSGYGMCLDHTASRSAAPMRDETIQQPRPNDDSPANQTFANSFQPEISSYVLHESCVEKDECKSLREGFGRPPAQDFPQPSFTFGCTTIKKSIDFEESLLSTRDPSAHIQEQQQLYVESITPEALHNVVETISELSNQITLYDEEGFELRGSVKKSVNQVNAMPSALTQSVFLEDSRVLDGNYDAVEQLCDKLNRTVEMGDDTEQIEPSFQLEASLVNERPTATQNQTHAMPEPSPNLTYIVQTPIVKSKINPQESVTLISSMDESKLSDGSESLHKKLNETRDKLGELEGKVANRRASASFKQILAEAKLNRSLGSQSPMDDSPAKKPEPSNCPPLKQARMFNKSTESPRYTNTKSVAVPTSLQQTPQASTRKSLMQHKMPSTLKALSMNRNRNDAAKMCTPTRNATPKVMASAHRRSAPNSALRAVANTPNLLVPICEMSVEINPLHGPFRLKSTEYIKWAQQLEFDPNWLEAYRVPKWNPLPENYLDKFGPTAGQEKTELKRKADRIVVKTINKFDGNMHKVRNYLWELAQLNAKNAQPYKNRMLELAKKHNELVEHYNSRMAYHNELIQQIDAKKHAEIQQFLGDLKQQVREVITEWKSDN